MPLISPSSLIGPNYFPGEKLFPIDYHDDDVVLPRSLGPGWNSWRNGTIKANLTNGTNKESGTIKTNGLIEKVKAKGTNEKFELKNGTIETNGLNGTVKAKGTNEKS